MAGSWDGTTYNGDDTAENVTGGSANEYFYGQGGADTMSGAGGADVMYGGDAADSLSGGDGDDILSGGDGADTLLGGDGDDQFNVDYSPGYAGVDSIDGGANTALGDLLALNLFVNDASNPIVSNKVTVALAATTTLKVGAATIATATHVERLSLYASDWKGAITATGGALDDEFHTGSGADSVTGGAGDDSIASAAGNDTLNGGDGNDTIVAGSGADSISAGAGDDGLFDQDDISSKYDYASATLPVGSDNDTLHGGDGNDYIVSAFGTDSLYGDAGDDQITVFLGRTMPANTRVDGGAGTDRLTAIFAPTSGSAAQDDTVSLTLAATTLLKVNGATAITAVGIEALSFDGSAGSGAMTIVGGAGSDSIQTGAGNDSLVGGGGDDVLNGGDGVDTIDGGEGMDTAQAGFGQGTKVTLGAGNDRLSLYQGSGPTTPIGGTYDGGADTDTLAIYADARAMRFVNGSGTLGGSSLGTFTGFEKYELNGGAASDTLTGGAGDDRLSGGYSAVADSLSGGGGADNISDGRGADTLLGQAGDDTILLSLDLNLDSIDGGTEIDTLIFNATYASVGAIVMSGDVQTGAQIKGGATLIANVRGIEIMDITGSNSADTLLGGSGADTIDGGLGFDSILSGEGDDDVTIRLDVAGAGKDQVALGGGTHDVLHASADYSVGGVVMSGTLANLTIKDGAGHLLATATGVEAVQITTDGNGYSNNAYGNDSLFGGAGNDTLSADAGANTLSGGGGDDQLSIRADALRDVIDGGAGVDDVLHINGLGQPTFLTVWSAGTLTMKAGGATTATVTGVERFDITGSSGADTLTGGDGADTLSGGSYGDDGNDSLSGGLGADFLEGADGADTINGGGGNDFIEVLGDGLDVIDGGSEIDTVYFFNGPIKATLIDGKIVNATLTDGTIIATLRNIENLTGSSGNDSLTGSATSNVLNGGRGDDTLSGGVGADTMIGGLGDDTYTVDNVGDVVTEFATEGENEFGGIDTVRSTITYSLVGSFVENLTLLGADTIGGTGNDFANLIIGNSASNKIDGGIGADTLNGGLGADTLNGGADNDVYYVDNVGDKVVEANGQGVDTVYSTVTFSLAGQFADNLTLTGTAVTNATGNTLNNTIIGNSAANKIDGGAGADVMRGGLGNDVYYVDNVGDKVIEANGQGVDTVYSSVTFSLAGQYADRLTLTGTTATGATGNALVNILTGNTIANTLDGDLGSDTMTGGAGADVFLFTTALGPTNIDHITDYATADDTIKLSHTIFDAIVGTSGTLTSAQFVANATGTATTLDQRIIYETDTGKLFYDADGSGGGLAKQFAVIDNFASAGALTNAEFVIVA